MEELQKVPQKNIERFPNGFVYGFLESPGAIEFLVELLKEIPEELLETPKGISEGFEEKFLEEF